MNIEQIKKVMKERKITQQQLSKLAGIPLPTLKCIFIGRTPNPRIDTMQAIEKALGLDKKFMPDISVEERQFIEALRELTEEEKKEFLSIAQFIISKRK